MFSIIEATASTVSYSLPIWAWIVAGLGVILLIAGLVHFGYIPMKVRSILIVVGVIFIAFALIAPAVHTTTPTQQIVPQHNAQVINMKGVTGVSSISGLKLKTDEGIVVNSTTGAYTVSNLTVSFQFDLYRTGNATSYQINLGNNPAMLNSTGVSENLIATYASNGTMQATIQTPISTVTGANAVVIIPSIGQTVQVNVTLHLNAKAVYDMMNNVSMDGIAGIGAKETFDIYAANNVISENVVLVSD